MKLSHKIWEKISSISDEKVRDNYTKRHGCNSCCPKCKTWESSGNKITTTPLDDGSDHRTCQVCGYDWLAIFTPAGFIPL